MNKQDSWKCWWFSKWFFFVLSVKFISIMKTCFVCGKLTHSFIQYIIYLQAMICGGRRTRTIMHMLSHAALPVCIFLQDVPRYSISFVSGNFLWLIFTLFLKLMLHTRSNQLSYSIIKFKRDWEGFRTLDLVWNIVSKRNFITYKY